MADIPNPQAFPGASVLQNGMTLRDWFAGQALSAMKLATLGVSASGALSTELCKCAYAYADAMLAERAKGGDA